MSKSILPAHILHCVPTILCFLIAVPASYSDVDERYALCSRQFNCGKRHLISSILSGETFLGHNIVVAEDSISTVMGIRVGVLQ
ncbi:hypothetical protein CUMW_270290 [Citrus unshiu]|nr:hypothetical protein CUMW_270290 [Citrus unshiu]